VLGPGIFNPGWGGHGFWDYSLSSNTWVANYAEDGTGAAIINNSIGWTTWVANLGEMSVPSIVRRGGARSVATVGWHPTQVQQLAALDVDIGRNLATTDHTGPGRVTIQTRRGVMGLIDMFTSTDEHGYYFARRYSASAASRGWYVDEFIPGRNGASMIGGLSGLVAAEGPGHAWTAAGLLVGPATTKRYVGYDPAMVNSTRLREGRRNIGDVFTVKPNAGPGEWSAVVVTKPGTRGRPWSPNTPYTQKRVGIPKTDPNDPPLRWNFPASVVEHDGFAYACTRTGRSADTMPAFASGGAATGPNAPVWTPRTAYWPGSLVRPTSANGRYYRLKQYPAWSPNTPVAPYQIVTTPNSNGNLFYAHVPRWTPRTHMLVGRIIQGTHPDGRVFRAKATTGNPPAYTGAEEPDWSALSDPTHELRDGSLVWEIHQLVTGAIEPPGLNPQTPGWRTQAKTATYDNNIEWRWFVSQTGPTEPTWSDGAGSETVDTPGATILPNGDVELGFGVVWVESGPDPAAAKVRDGDCEWTRVDVLPKFAYTMRVGPEVSASLTGEALKLTLTPGASATADDAAGQWEQTRGDIGRSGARVATYAASKRLVPRPGGGVSVAAFTLTVVFDGTGGLPAGNLTVRGAQDGASPDVVGGISAASTAYALYVGRHFKLTGSQLTVG
jgi:hypothetical protein